MCVEGGFVKFDVCWVVFVGVFRDRFLFWGFGSLTFFEFFKIKGWAGSIIFGS